MSLHWVLRSNAEFSGGPKRMDVGDPWKKMFGPEDYENMLRVLALVSKV